MTMDETDQHFIGTTLPLDDVDAGDVDLVGRLAELVARVSLLTEACHATQPLIAWVELFKQVIETAGVRAADDSWQLSHAYHSWVIWPWPPTKQAMSH